MTREYTCIETETKSFPKTKSELIDYVNNKIEYLNKNEMSSLAEILSRAIEWCNKLPESDFPRLTSTQFLKIGAVIPFDEQEIYNIQVYRKNKEINVLKHIAITSSAFDEDKDEKTIIKDFNQ